MRKTLPLLLLLIISLSATAQDSLRRNIFTATLQDHAAIWKSSIQLKQHDYSTLIPVFAAGGAAIYFDEIVSAELVNSRKRFGLGEISNGITHMGDPYVLGPAVALAYGSGWLFGDSKLRQTAVMAAEAYFHNGIFTYIGKLAFARQRPFVDGTDHWHFFPYSLQGHDPSATAYQSFPSGHTSGIWAIATVFAKQYRDTKWVPVLAYSAATLTGISRVTENKHWLSDVIFGAALGYGIGNFVVKRNRNTNFTLFPTYWDNSVSLTMQLEF